MDHHRILNPLAADPFPAQDIADVLSRYDVGDLVALSLATNGVENTNYFVTTEADDGERRFVLTVVEQPSYSGHALVPLLDRLNDAGLPVPAVTRNRAGTAVERLHDKTVLLAPRLPGRHVFNPTNRQCQALGRFLARFHRASRALTSEMPPHPRDSAWLTRHAERATRYSRYASMRLLVDAVRTVRSLLSRDDVRRLPQGVIHGDLFRDNVLFTERGLAGVLDFHHAARGYLVFDLAVAANDWCTDADGVPDPDRTLSLLRSYHAIRPIEPRELWFLPTFTLYAALAFWLSRLTVTLGRDRGSAGRFKNPEELEQIVARHQTHFHYVDARLLER